MAASDWSISTPYISLSDLMEALNSLRSQLGFRIPAETDAVIADAMAQLLKQVKKAQKILKHYLFELTASPTSKDLTPNDVIKVFEDMISMWEKIPSNSHSKFIKSQPIRNYESIRSLLQNPNALKAVRDYVTIADIVDDIP